MAGIGGAMEAVGRGDLPAAFDSFFAAVCGRDYRPILQRALGAHGLLQAERNSAFFFTNEIPAFSRWTPADLRRIASPVLLVQGAASPAATHRLIARLAMLLPHARVATFEGANHLLPLTRPAELAQLITSWSGTTDRPTAATATSPPIQRGPTTCKP
jgi:pimeloyl-ACP methyl ester carboxylesterase